MLFTITPMQMSYYAPFPSMINEMAPEQNSAFVSGNVMWNNYTPCIDIELRLFGTDDMKEEYVTTDDTGYFISIKLFSSGQIITVSYEGNRLAPTSGRLEDSFVRYDIVDNSIAYLGEFIIWWL